MEAVVRSGVELPLGCDALVTTRTSAEGVIVSLLCGEGRQERMGTVNALSRETACERAGEMLTEWCVGCPNSIPDAES